MLIAFIDDRRENLEAWLAAMSAIVDGSDRLLTYSSIAEYRRALDGGLAPDVLFVDFFLPDGYGTDVIAIHTSAVAGRPFMIAHSSMAAANEGMLRSGADYAIDKIKGSHPSSTILKRLPTRLALVDLIRSARTSRRSDDAPVQ